MRFAVELVLKGRKRDWDYWQEQNAHCLVQRFFHPRSVLRSAASLRFLLLGRFWLWSFLRFLGFGVPAEVFVELFLVISNNCHDHFFPFLEGDLRILIFAGLLATIIGLLLENDLEFLSEGLIEQDVVDEVPVPDFGPRVVQTLQVLLLGAALPPRLVVLSLLWQK